MDDYFPVPEIYAVGEAPMKHGIAPEIRNRSSTDPDAIRRFHEQDADGKSFASGGGRHLVLNAESRNGRSVINRK